MPMTSGWWILPAAIGGLVFWIALAMYAPEWFAVMLLASIAGFLLRAK